MPIPDAMASASPLGFAKTELSRGVDLLHSLSSGHAPFGRLARRAGGQPG